MERTVLNRVAVVELQEPEPAVLEGLEDAPSFLGSVSRFKQDQSAEITPFSMFRELNDNYLKQL